MAAPRLRAAGVDCAEARDPRSHRPGHRLYELLAEQDAASAHGRYNALVGRLVSFARAAERCARLLTVSGSTRSRALG